MGVPIALTIAGSDSSGGAGIQADLKSFSALGVYGASALTAITAQNTIGVSAIHVVPPEIVAAQIKAVLEDLAVKAIKIGMLGAGSIVDSVADALSAYRPVPVVLDPVMVAQTGAALIDDGAVARLIERLFPLARLITPNLPEAARLLGQEMAQSEEEMAAQGRELLRLGASAVLVKGGHGEGADAVDLLVTPQGVRRFSAARVLTGNSHGTGCSLSAAIAANVARGFALEDAIGRAKAWLTEGLRHADELDVGKGQGPIHHFHHLWSKADG